MTIDAVTIKSPGADSGVKEYYEYIRTDNKSINGTMQRNQIAKKKVAELTWHDLKPTEIQAILVWADDTTTHAYSNTTSKYGTWAFTGIVTITNDGDYEPGASYMTDEFSVMIREV
jgi:hypothetical protein